MRIVSLLPATTEILFGIGAGDDVVGVTFECDFPTQARSRTVVSTSALPDGLSPREIDEFVAAAARRGEDLYRLKSDALLGLDADVVVTQDLCEVCAIDVSTVDDALSYLGCHADVVTHDPHTVHQILDSVLALGQRTGHETGARDLVAALEQRLDNVRRAVEHQERPRVLVVEWTDPPFAPGHWIPEMVELAGGVPVLGEVGKDSFRTTWEDAVATQPDVVVCAPCGYDLDTSARMAAAVTQHFPDTPVWAVDANASFTRPGPRVVDGIEDLAAILHPDVPGFATSGARRV